VEPHEASAYGNKQKLHKAVLCTVVLYITGRRTLPLLPASGKDDPRDCMKEIAEEDNNGYVVIKYFTYILLYSINLLYRELGFQNVLKSRKVRECLYSVRVVLIT
jgi:hypothetical protein